MVHNFRGIGIESEGRQNVNPGVQFSWIRRTSVLPQLLDNDASTFCSRHYLSPSIIFVGNIWRWKVQSRWLFCHSRLSTTRNSLPSTSTSHSASQWILPRRSSNDEILNWGEGGSCWRRSKLIPVFCWFVVLSYFWRQDSVFSGGRGGWFRWESRQT